MASRIPQTTERTGFFAQLLKPASSKKASKDELAPETKIMAQTTITTLKSAEGFKKLSPLSRILIDSSIIEFNANQSLTSLNNLCDTLAIVYRAELGPTRNIYNFTKKDDSLTTEQISKFSTLHKDVLYLVRVFSKGNEISTSQKGYKKDPSTKQKTEKLSSILESESNAELVLKAIKSQGEISTEHMFDLITCAELAKKHLDTPGSHATVIQSMRHHILPESEA
jgi:hypothetical protein